MEKSAAVQRTNTLRAAPAGAGTSTSSGVTVYEPSMSLQQNPPPPSYEQATGTINTTTTTTTRQVNYNTNANPNSNMGWANNAPPSVVGQQYVSFTSPLSSSTTAYTYAPAASPPMVHHVQPQLQQQHTMMQGPVVIVQQPMMPLGPEPVFITCPACHCQKLTRIEYEPSSRTHLMAAMLCVFGLWCCVCLPYCAGSCMNTQHFCGNCNKYLGTYGNAL